MREEKVVSKTKINRHTSIAQLSFIDSIKVLLDQFNDKDLQNSEKQLAEIKQVQAYRAQCNAVVQEIAQQILEGKAESAIISIKPYLFSEFKWLFENDTKLAELTYSIIEENMSVSIDTAIFVQIKRKEQ